MRLVPVLVVLILATSVVAGCLGGGGKDKDREEEPPAVPADWHERPFAAGSAHDHADALQHQNLSTPNFEVVAYDPLVTDHYGRTAGSSLCADVAREGERQIGIAHSFYSEVALLIVDLTDPTAPQLVGELVMPNTKVYDVAITPDGRYAVLGTSTPDRPQTPSPALPAAPPAPYFRDACTGDVRQPGPLAQAPLDSGIVLIDLADPADPQIADYKPLPLLGAHSVFATLIDGTYFALGAVTNLEHHGSYFSFYTIQDTVLGPRLMAESAFDPLPPTDDNQPAINGHVDGTIAKHPGTGVTLAYLAHWDAGLIIVDLSDPKNPQEIGRWSGYSFQPPSEEIYDDDSGSVHSALPLDMLWGDKHYTFIGQEVVGRPADTPTGVIHILDTTDPSDPQVVSAWTLPYDPVWEDALLWSTHYVTYSERTLFVTMYHGGLWAVDLSDPAMPRSAGVFVPATPSPKPPTEADMRDMAWAPMVGEAQAIGLDSVVVWDANTGVYTVRYDPTVRVPAVAEWPVKLPDPTT